ncbi:hypothetical protein LshimejAT787_1602710 [Lyophyllum shimeji]|uniref:Uncharacterized protein n=1 Tax=Lyophyllum shimeji TaxID=47721 RepID=A0A9P3Q074_LYOSH|nr:hypothetical protein LshimejAT787_1602710 [Lyophyllum shimeji]
MLSKERHVAKGHVVLNENAKAHEHILHQIHDAVRPALDEASIVEQDSTPAVPLVPQVLRQLSEAIAQRQFFAPVVTNHLEDKLGSGPMIKGLPSGTLGGTERHCKTCTCNVEDKVDDRSTDYLEDEPDLSSGTHRTLPPSKRPLP